MIENFERIIKKSSLMIVIISGLEFFDREITNIILRT